ncbi:MAG: polymer-forming cytoskeletal protein [Pseudomonadota bacterium]
MARKTKIDKGVTLIAAHTEVIGDIRFADQLFVSGKVTGNVLADNEKATVVIGDEGCVNGEVRVPNIIINGLIEGDVYASNKVELAPQARVHGNLYYKLIEMQLGAVVDGQLLHEQNVGDSKNVHQLNVDSAEAE